MATSRNKRPTLTAERFVHAMTVGYPTSLTAAAKVDFINTAWLREQLKAAKPKPPPSSAKWLKKKMAKRARRAEKRGGA